MSKTLARLLVQAAHGIVETSIDELFDVFGLAEDRPSLQNLQQLSTQLEEYGLLMTPTLAEGSFETSRCISLGGSGISADTALCEIGAPEATRLEFKSSLFLDHQKHRANPGLRHVECRSESVTHSALKSVAAFLNTQGGLLYLGVSDDREILGLGADNRCLGMSQDADLDTWQLTFQELLKIRFKDGGSVGPYVKVTFVIIAGKAIARVQVASRSKLTFLKGKDQKEPWRLYRRDGNRTVEVTIDQVEDYLSTRELAF